MNIRRSRNPQRNLPANIEAKDHAQSILGDYDERSEGSHHELNSLDGIRTPAEDEGRQRKYFGNGANKLLVTPESSRKKRSSK